MISINLKNSDGVSAIRTCSVTGMGNRLPRRNEIVNLATSVLFVVLATTVPRCLGTRHDVTPGPIVLVDDGLVAERVGRGGDAEGNEGNRYKKFDHTAAFFSAAQRGHQSRLP